MSLINGTSTSAFYSCTAPPATQTLYTTIYEKILPAACETSSWLATYTITETCAGNPAEYVTPTLPPGFVVTTVSCSVCDQKEIEITCPGAQPTGMPPTVAISGNGVTATITASPAPAPAMGSNGGSGAQPTGGAVPPVTAVGGQTGAGGAVGGSSGSSGASNPGSGSSGSGASGSGASGSSSSGSGSSGSGSSGSGSSGSGSGSTGSGSPGVIGGSNVAPGSNVSSGAAGSSSSGSSGSSGESGMGGASGNGTSGSQPIPVTAAAPSLRDGFMLFSGLALVAGQFFLL
ncbi:hypothetical protein F4779DRAFT_266799 [Xylariaceae sp. FL0662B]|nr:hypothetical protein F4779DRAFT_266799 [Xylariaceae sp. FL0662B]